VTGGRIASSDETATFLLVESIVHRGSLDVPPGIIQNGSFHNGKFYIWYEIGQSLLAIPLYLTGYAITSLIDLPPAMKILVLKACMGTFNAFIGALYAVCMFLFSQKLGYKLRTSLLLTVGLCVSTFAFPYLKTFLREPLLALALLGTCYFLHQWSINTTSQRFLLLAGILTGIGVLTRTAFIINVLPMVFFIFAMVWNIENKIDKAIRASIMYLLPIFMAGLGILWYNYARFGNPFDLGYQSAGISFDIPFYVGLYGLLLSSGKSFFLFAPLTIVGIVGLQMLFRKRVVSVYLWIAIIAINLLFYSKYYAWGGDGSWGPRYLLSLLPFFVLPVGEIIEKGQKISKIVISTLILIGVIFQLAGTSIYAGTYLREIGEFPYTRSFTEPEFLYKAHFIPNYSPIVGHWRMALHNFKEHLSGNIPTIQLNEDAQATRIPIQEENTSSLRHTFDYWFCYPLYVGYRSIIFFIVPLLMVLLIIIQWLRLRRMVSRT